MAQGIRATEEQLFEAIRQYNAGKTAAEVAPLLGYSVSGAKFALRRAGVEMRRSGARAGEASKLLKRVKYDGAGYKRVWITEDHPHRRMADARGYVLEHRLLIAEVEGRNLLRSETVHHINGVHDDNRLENLQLMRSAHPAGTRPVCASCGSTDITHQEIEQE